MYNKENVLWDFKMKDFSFSEVVSNQNYDINIPGEQLTDGGERFPCSFLKIYKKYSYFRGKCFDCVHMRFKFLI